MPKVLIVDDSEIVRTAMRHDLEERGLSIVSAVDGINAIREMKDHPDIDLIITDFNMPNMDGLTMIESIRNDMRNTEVKIIVLTTEDCADLKERGRSLGITGWVVKPITPEVVDIIATVVLGGK